MNTKQRNFAIHEAANYADPDAFVSDMLLSDAFLPAGEEGEPDLSEAEPLRRIWHTVCDPFRAFLKGLGLSQTACAERFCIPLRTVQGWALEERQCPVYLRLMMAEIMEQD